MTSGRDQRGVVEKAPRHPVEVDAAGVSLKEAKVKLAKTVREYAARHW